MVECLASCLYPKRRRCQWLAVVWIRVYWSRRTPTEFGFGSWNQTVPRHSGPDKSPWPSKVRGIVL